MTENLFHKGIAALLGPPLAGVLIEAVGHRGPALQVGACHDVHQSGGYAFGQRSSIAMHSSIGVCYG